MDREHPTNAELESQFNERNNNLRKDISSIVNTVCISTVCQVHKNKLIIIRLLLKLKTF